MLTCSITGACEEGKLNSDHHRDIKRAGLCDVVHSESEELGVA